MREWKQKQGDPALVPFFDDGGAQMNHVRVASLYSDGRVYHDPGCHYIKNTLPEYRLKQPWYDMEKCGYRPCKCCNSMKFRLEKELDNLQRYSEHRELEFKMIAGELYIKTGISCWKIVYWTDTQDFAIFHRNHKNNPLDFAHPEKESYHRQKDIRSVTSLIDAFKYVYKHDEFRKAEKAANGNLEMSRIDRKYQASARRRQRRQQARQLDYLFREIENGNEEYRKISFC
ncbi:MAG: hypothetical protein LUE63_10385 [Lachnospiraceae bacterium]|nr:hypothetical protein [Lachnospiraceae bacterium]